MNKALARNPAQLAFIEGRHVHRLADALLIAASEEQLLPPGAMLAALAMALGRLTGSVARDSEESVTLLCRRVADQVQRVARLEFRRRVWSLQ
jgi:hypothetical protein